MVDAMLSRRTLLAGAAASLSFTTPHYPANAAEIVLRFGNNQPPSYPLNVRMREAAERIRERSSGNVEVQIFPQGQLGTDTDMISQVRAGRAHPRAQLGQCRGPDIPA